MSKWLLVSDLDDTLLGNSDAWAEFCAALSASPDILIALNSSRPWGSVVGSLLGNYPALNIRASICGMGTQLRVDDREVSQWNLRFAGWHRSGVDQLMHRLGFEPHAPQFQTAYKASFTVPQGSSQALARSEIANMDQACRVITSGGSDFDVLPPLAGKGEATLFLARHLGIPTSRVIVAGDSANDLAMFEVAEKGIVVGNARAELRCAVDPSKVYFAKGARAAGVLEGLRYWGAPLVGEEAGIMTGGR